jgi:4-hydroxy-tetrahydrodipicolinate synthase
MAKNKKFDGSGTGVAIVCPFTKTGAVDYPALEKLVNYLIAGGVDYLVVHGTTGESATLTSAEKIEVLESVKKYVKNRVEIVLGVGSNNTAEVIEGFKKFDFKGVSAILSVSPYYNKPNQEGIYLHFAEIAKHAPKPIILYNVPGRTGMNMTSDTTLRLAKEFKNIIAIKEASGNMEQCMRIIANKPKGFEVLSGDDNLTLPMIACGAKGVISVVAMAYPKEFSSMVNLCLEGKFEKATKLHYDVMPMTDLIFADGNPGGIKAALKIKGITTDKVRLPLANVNATVYKAIEKILK